MSLLACAFNVTRMITLVGVTKLIAQLDIRSLCDKLVEIINREEGSLHPRDDATIIGLDFSEK